MPMYVRGPDEARARFVYDQFFLAVGKKLRLISDFSV